MSQFLIVMLVQLLLVLLCMIGGVAFFNYRRRHEEDVGAQLLVYNINSHKDLRIDSLTTLIEKAYGSQGEELKNIVDQLYMKEADCYRELIQLFINRDPKQLTKMYDAVQKITAAYEGMLLQFNSESKSGSTQQGDDNQKYNRTPDAPVVTELATPVLATPVVESSPFASPADRPPMGKSVQTDLSESSTTAFSAPSTDGSEDNTLSVNSLDVKMAESPLVAPPGIDLASDKKVANNQAEVIKDANLQPVLADLLPVEQEMAYYQDKLMTYLETKEVSKGSVTELLDKDNQKEVAKEQ